MDEPIPNRQAVRFGVFAVDLKAGELRRSGSKVKLQEQPFQILRLLLERPGEVVTHDEIIQVLWPNGTIVEYEHSVKTAVKKLRQALGDDADTPRYVETLPRRGYRFIYPVDGAVPVPARQGQPRGATLQELEPGVGTPASPADDVASAGPPGSDLDSAKLIGQKVSHYRVLGVVGSGGMGVVYRAEDVRLGRQVALKFLPDELTDSPQALERFEREARAASTLNHPNICTIHEVEEHEGKPFIVMELLEGQTLRERLAARSESGQGSGLTVHELLTLAIQIADGLDAAHQKGIIHRDIKPANIFITRGSQTKILDFGLAKLTESVPSKFASVSEDRANLADHEKLTASADRDHLTREGAMMGTAAYMSPEQIRGEKIDARTDLFSFGLVLYEMATGRQAFSGATTGVIHEAILNQAPQPITGANPNVPPNLEGIVWKALEKDRDLRYQHASDIRADLKRLRRDTDSGRRAATSMPIAGASRPIEGGEGHRQESVLDGSKQARAEPSETHAARRWPLWLAGSLAVIVIGVAVASFLLRRPPQPPTELTQKRLTFNSSDNFVWGGAISPDGKYLAYSDPAGIHVKLLSTGEERLIPKPTGVPADAGWNVQSWFPDGTRLLTDLWDAGRHQSMWTVSILGQPPRELHEGSAPGRVSPDGTLIAFVAYAPGIPDDYREIWVMGSRGDHPEKVLAVGKNEVVRFVHWAPDGKRLAYIRKQLTLPRDLSSIETCDLKAANRTVVVSEPNLVLFDFYWLPDGRIIYSRQESPDSGDYNLWQIGIDGSTGVPIGRPKRITRWPESVVQRLSASADGKQLALVKTTFQQQVYLGELAAGGTRMTPPRRLTTEEASNAPYSWTADSKAVLFASDRDGQWGIFKQGIAQDTAENVITGPQGASGPLLSPDGAWILYKEFLRKAGRSTPVALLRIPVNGGVPQQVLEMRNDSDYLCARPHASLCMVSEVSQDEKRVTVTALDPLKGRGKVLRTLERNGSIGDYPSAPSGLSPDGSSLAISTSQGAESHIRLLALSGGPDSEITVKGWPNVAGLNWSPDGKGFYVGSVSPQLGTLLYIDVKGNARVLWQHKGTGLDDPIWGVPSPDGRYLAIQASASNSNMWMLEGF